jgi:hypothetical protein
MKMSRACAASMFLKLTRRLFYQRQAEQRDLLERDGLTAAWIPVRFAVAALQQVLSRGFHPFGLDGGYAPRVDPLRL